MFKSLVQLNVIDITAMRVNRCANECLRTSNQCALLKTWRDAHNFMTSVNATNYNTIATNEDRNCSATTTTTCLQNNG